ncbi:TetR family transcriptional regulator [Paenibacillus xylaniclasticus]|uniref:TetR family transcriptional regulator n=1 Tax=Paenibacillus xylaniclasticus TaxID=588083 RepID=UPI000FD95138|nr:MULTISPECIES: TetR family transcriptional regulator [Paenibacillus]GFN29763.1 TetR family transcriptional regulator [Paenibacillus curdlanolyticus]
MKAIDSDIKQRILIAAKSRFAKQGFDGTTVRQICEDAGVNGALISYYFGGKENLFYAMFENFFPLEAYDELNNMDLDPVEGVKLIVREITAFKMREPMMTVIIQQEMLLNSPRLSRIREYAAPPWRRLREWIEKGMEQGVFHSHSVDNAFFSVLGTLLYYRNSSSYWEPLLKHDSGDLEQLVDDLTGFVLGGLMKFTTR